MKLKASRNPKTNSPVVNLGWREWVALPELGIERVKAKVDTGARTSALHAYFVEPYTTAEGERRVRFGIHPRQKDVNTEIVCDAAVLDEREISDSGGHTETRIIIATKLILGDKQLTAEVSLTNRDTMKFRMLIGRTALKRRYAVDPSKSYLAGEPQVEKKS